MPPWPRGEKTYHMGLGKPGDSELERELDSLYQKVAGLDSPEDKANIQKPSRARSAKNKKRRFRTSPFYWGLVFTLFFFVTIGLFYWPGVYYYGILQFRGTAYPLKTNRLTGEARYYNGKEWLRPPVDTGIIVLPAEEPRNQIVAPPLAEEKEKVLAEPPLTQAPPGDRQGRYGLQIRAFPEDQKQNALMFLEDMRKRAPDVSMETVSIEGRGVWHRILLGNFLTAEEAAEYQKNDGVAREHPYGFIQRKHRGGPVSSPAPRSAAGEPSM